MQLLSHPDEKPTLYVHEWLAVACFLGLLGMLTAIACLSSDPIAKAEVGESITFQQNISVILTGAVEHPGTYTLKKGTQIQELLKLGKTLPEADLKKVSLKRKLRAGQTVHIPYQHLIKVSVKPAAGDPIELLVPKGTKVSDLIPMLNLPETAALQKKRRLKDNEVITLP